MVNGQLLMEEVLPSYPIHNSQFTIHNSQFTIHNSQFMNNLEVEVKFYIPDLTAVRERLLADGGQLSRARVYERNVRFDTLEESLLQKYQLLRLRQDSRVRLTFKGTPQQPTLSEAKVREELEIEVSDFDTAALIIQRLGFLPLQVYEKYRETFSLGSVEVVLDELPFGNFVELEGEESAIRTAAAQLGLDWQKRILENYLALMGRLRAHPNLPFIDLTFANFKELSVSVADVLEA
jgi:adenylate cyclase, class 2